MNCPSCHGGMEPLTLRAHLGTPLQIDVCWGCQVIWFDPMESVALSAQSVIELFRRINAEKRESRNLVAMNPACPRCVSPLAITHDLGRGGSFSYHRCLNGHGRLISFTQFLREKNFIRSLNPAELQHLAVTIKQIRCSSCGASINLETDTACTHCGSAISVLDEDAVKKALEDFASHTVTPRAPSPEIIADIALSRLHYEKQQQTRGDRMQPAAAELLVDLVADGIAALFK